MPWFLRTHNEFAPFLPDWSEWTRVPDDDGPKLLAECGKGGCLFPRAQVRQMSEAAAATEAEWYESQLPPAILAERVKNRAPAGRAAAANGGTETRGGEL